MSKRQVQKTPRGRLKTGLVFDSIYEEHSTPPGHPECPARCSAIVAALKGAGLLKSAQRIPARSATVRELGLVHRRTYIDTVMRDVNAGQAWLSTGDTPICEKSFEVALFAAGGVLSAVDVVVEGRAKNAFCAVRPPGHHATPTRGKGFCIFNNIAIAARYAQKKHKLEKILIVDWDVHHGDGTQEIFYEDGSVFYFSTHQWPWYPGTGLPDETGSGAGEGTTLNCVFPRGAERDEILAVYQEKLAAAAERFKPDLVLISAGFDSAAGDPLGMLGLTDDDFGAMTRAALGVARKHSQGRLVSALEGGYDLTALASAVLAHVRELAAG